MTTVVMVAVALIVGLALWIRFRGTVLGDAMGLLFLLAVVVAMFVFLGVGLGLI